MPSRYLQTAATIKTLIDKGVYKAGERLPSVRLLSEKMQISVTTVINAYRVLENQDLIEIIPQSGHFVRSNRSRLSSSWLKNNHANDQTQEPQIAQSTTQLLAQLYSAKPAAEVYQFALSEPAQDLVPQRELQKIMQKISRQHLDLMSTAYDQTGLPALTTQIIRHLFPNMGATVPDDVVITDSCQQALVFCLQACTQAGDTIAVESPAYAGFLLACELLGLKTIEIPQDKRSGMNLAALEQALQHYPIKACFAMPCLSNPTGSSMSEAKKNRLYRLLQRFQLPLIEGHDYSDLLGIIPIPLKARDVDGLVMLCGSTARSLSPGLRTGWILPGRFVDSIRASKILQGGSVPLIYQHTLAEFMACGAYKRHLQRVRKHYRQRLAKLQHLLLTHLPAGTQIQQPHGGFVLWVKLPTVCDSLKIYQAAQQQGIIVAPGILFSKLPQYRNFIRISSADRWDAKASMAIMRLGEIIESTIGP